MSFPRYPKYKESGLEWLGQVPEHWELRRISHYFSERREKVSDTEYQALSVTMGGIVPQIETAAKSDDGDNRKRVCKGDFVINSRSDRKGSSGVSPLDGSVSLICTVLYPNIAQSVHMPFVHHLLRSRSFQEEFYRNGKGIVADLWSTNFSAMRNILLGMPSLPEQYSIAEFLDCETAKIDALVTEQERLIELLKEKRQAVISHAVTKGLNPNTPMKPTGIEFLGNIPSHWKVKRLKRVCNAFPSNVDKKSYPDQTPVRLCNYTDVYYNDFITNDMDLMSATATQEQIDKFTLRSGDIIITKDSETADDIAISAYVPSDLPGVICGYHLCMVRPFPGTCGLYIKRLFDSIYVKTCVEVRANGLTRVGLGQYEIDNIELPVPPYSEQLEITDFLDKELEKVQKLVSESQLAILVLKERRTALISAAVTGQIDVRQISKKDAA